MDNHKGIATLPSPFSVEESINRIVAFLQQQGAIIYARINQQKELASIGRKILPMEILMFGNPRSGGPLMALNPVSALDLPLKILAWQDEQNKCWIAFNQVEYIKDRYEIPDELMLPLNLNPLISKVFAEH